MNDALANILLVGRVSDSERGVPDLRVEFRADPPLPETRTLATVRTDAEGTFSFMWEVLRKVGDTLPARLRLRVLGAEDGNGATPGRAPTAHAHPEATGRVPLHPGRPHWCCRGGPCPARR